MPAIAWRNRALAVIAAAAVLTAAPVVAPELVAAQRAQPQQVETYSDAQLRAFAKTRAQIQPLQLSQFAAATPTEQTRAAAKINAVLARNGLTREDYDAIATVAQADPQFAARIARLATPNGLERGG